MTVIAGEHVYGRHKPLVTAALIVLNVAVYFYTSGGTLIRTLTPYLVEFGFKPAYLVSDPFMALKTGISSMFIHADLFHLFFNMLFLWVFGSRVERLLGHLKTAFLYFTSGFAALLFHTSFVPFSGLTTLGVSAVGASGAISGLLGTYLLLLPKTSLVMCTFFLFIPFCFRLPAYVFLILWFVQQVVYGYLVLGGVAYFAHIGGFVMGLILTPILARSLVRRVSYPGDSLIRYMEEVLGIIFPRSTGLSPMAKLILVLFLLIVSAGFIYNYYVLEADRTTAYSSLVTVQTGGNVQSEVVVFTLSDGTLDFSPISTDNVRILVNRIDIYLYNPVSAGSAIRVYEAYSRKINDVLVPVVINATIIYDDFGFARLSEGIVQSRVVNIYVRRGVIVSELGDPIEIGFSVRSTKLDFQVFKALCLISSAISLLAIPAVLLFKGIRLYEWTPLLPVI